jgi:hypothetical protein
MPDRSNVASQTKKDILLLEVGLGADDLIS